MRTTLGQPVKTASFIVIAFLSVAILSCKSNPNQSAARQTKPQTSEAPLPPPTLDDVRTKVESIYHGALIIDSRREPVFLLGDFNADRSEDVLVAVRPNPQRLADLNSELAAWILEDPRQIWVPDPNKGVQVLPRKPRAVRVRAGDRPWVIIHGFREKGWRNPLATQSYLLVNVHGQGLRRESVREASAELKQVPPPVGIQYLLRYDGDVLRETVAGEPRLLYWTGGHYAWTAPL